MYRRWWLGVVFVALMAVACRGPGVDRPGPGESLAPVKGYPSTMVALGDSITAGFGSCLTPTRCPRNSWATGDGTQVLSHYRRILAVNPAISGNNRTQAVPGATVADLPEQAAAAAKLRADYVTVLIGANDACRGTMTSSTDFRASFDRALRTIKRAMPRARILVVSIPDVYRVWQVGHTSRVARAAWASGVCPNLLANPTSTAPADEARRQAFRDQIKAYNGQLEAACAAYGGKCRYADVSRFAFSLSMLSAIDFFHPNAAGQEALADESYPGRFTW